MHTQLYWTKHWLGSSCTLFADDSQVGSLKENVWSQSAVGTLNDKRYSFHPKGFFRQRSLITDIDSGSVIGEIAYNFQKNRATVSYRGEQYDWRFSFLRQNAWKVTVRDQVEINYRESYTKRVVTIHDYDALLVLAGLHIANYLKNVSMVTVAAAAAVVPMVAGS